MRRGALATDQHATCRPVTEHAPTSGPAVLVIDESVVEPRPGGRLTYVVAVGTIIAAERGDASAAAIAAIDHGGTRSRPFHWATEGPRARTAMRSVVETWCQLAIVATVSDTPHRHQEAARAHALAAILDEVANQQVDVDQLIIESRERALGPVGQNKVDHGAVVEARHRGALARKVRYRWADKSEPLLWLADATAGMASDAALGRPEHLRALAASTSLTALALPPP